MTTSEQGRDRRFAALLVAWFAKVARSLPWRPPADGREAVGRVGAQRDPYRVWISEVMLQQTRVETVVPYFERFIARFPTSRDLAAADLDAVLAMWSGLGYYRRARALHVAAREVVDRFGGELPRDADALRSLHGVGPYTAGAIASLAFGLPEALVDGNVARVFARFDGIDAPIDAPATKRLLWETARRRVPLASPGAFNEALMELGATVCTPKSPRCDACPAADLCVARASGRVAELPVASARKAVPTVGLVAAVFARGREVLLGQRAPDGLFGGLFEPPMVEAKTLTAARKPLRAMGLTRAADLRAIEGRVEHVLTHRRLEVVVATASGGDLELPSPNATYTRFTWAPLEATDRGTSTLTRKLLARAKLG